MRYIIALLLFCVAGNATAQWSPTNNQFRWIRGAAYGCKDTASFVAVGDTGVITRQCSDGKFYIKGSAGSYWEKVGIGGTVLWSDTGRVNGQIWTAYLANKTRDSLAIAKLNISDTASMLSGYNLQRVTNLGATTTNSITAPNFIGNLKSSSSAGNDILTNSGSVVAEWGVGGGLNFDFHGFAGMDYNRSGGMTSTSFTPKVYVDSSDALRVRYTDTAAMLSGYNLQRVTNLGSTTTKNITANSFLLPASGNAITTDGSSMYIKAGNGNIYIGRDNVVKAEPDGKLSALSFIKSGGTSAQFLKADGSVDGNTYATTSALSGYLPLTGGTLTGSLSGTSLSMSGATQLATSSGRVLIKTTTDNGTDALQVAGTTISNGYKIGGNNTFILNSITGTQSQQIQYQNNGTDKWQIYLNTANNNLSFYSSANTADRFVLAESGAATFSSSVTATSYVQGGYLVATGSTGLVVLTSADWGASSEIRNSTTINGVSGGDYLSFKNPTGKGFSFVVNGSSVASVSSSGAVTATAFYESSDLRQKTVHTTLKSADGIDAIQYTFNPTDSDKWGYGAQQVQPILPYAVSKGEDGFFKVDYTTVHTYKIAQLEKRIAELEKLVKK